MSQTDGLKDTIACDTRISQIVDDSLSYAGYNISELVEPHASFEEVIYLLWHLHLPTQIELKHFEEDLRANYAISDAAVYPYPVPQAPSSHECLALNGQSFGGL